LRYIKNDSCAGDVWALGVTLYLLLTDRLPFPDPGDMYGFDNKSFYRQLIPPSRLNLAVDESLEQIVFKALALKREDRYPTAKELLDDLCNWKPCTVAPTRVHPEAKVVSSMSKNVLGRFTPPNQAAGEKMAAQALKLAQETGNVLEAADLMEEAFNRWPDLRNRYEHLVRLWRRGIAM
jgi:serine/threonine protein kinase